MKIHECKKENGLILLKADRINIISCNSGEIILPQAKKTCLLQLLFIVHAEFKISARGKEIIIGSSINISLRTEPGVPGFDTQPSFLYRSTEDKWYALSIGSFGCGDRL